MFPNPISWLGMKKLNLTQQKDTLINKKRTTTQKKLKPGLVASYSICPGNGEGLFWFSRFINLSLTYLVKAKFHYTSWFKAGHRQVRCQIPLPYLVRTSFEPDNVMEFGGEPASSC